MAHPASYWVSVQRSTGPGAGFHPTAVSDVKYAAVLPLPLTPSWPDLYLYLDVSSAEQGELVVRKLLLT